MSGTGFRSRLRSPRFSSRSYVSFFFLAWDVSRLPRGADDRAQTRKHITAIPYAPFQLHSIVLAAFASLVAPFGGFFASGFKRAAGIKDFGNSLPGHGGFLDRMDCQFLMGLFTFVYHSSLVREIHASPSQILSAFATLTTEQQVQVLEMLKHVVDHKSVRA